jgi:hypothetical protein
MRPMAEHYRVNLQAEAYRQLTVMADMHYRTRPQEASHLIQEAYAEFCKHIIPEMNDEPAEEAE